MMLLHILLTSTIILAEPDNVNELTKEELSQALLDSQASMKTASVTCDYRLRNGIPGQGLLAPTEQHGVCTFDSIGRCRYEGYGDVPIISGGRPQWEKWVAVFDGKRMKMMRGDKERYTHGKVSEIARTPFPWPMDPREYLYNFSREQIGKIISEDGSRIGGWTSWQGRRVLVAESKTFVDAEDGSKTKFRFLIDPNWGFAVVRRSFSIYRPSPNDWFDYNVVEGHDYREVVSGLWLPSRVTWNMYGQSTTVLDPFVLARHEVKNSNWVINGDIPDSAFELEFAPAILVTDEQTGKTYQTVKIRDGQVVEQVGEGIEIYQEKKASSLWRTIAYWVAGGVLGASLLIVVAVRQRARRRTLQS